MKNKMISRSFAAAMATATMLSTMGLSVCAASEGIYQGDNLTEIPAGKILTTDGTTYQPDTTFSFSVSNGNGTTESTQVTDDKGNLVYAGVTGGLYTDASCGAVFSAASQSSDQIQAIYQANGKLKLDVTAFPKPGVFHYLVSETPSTYDGITSDTNIYDVYVYVYTDDAGNLSIKNVVAKKQTPKGPVKADLTFSNDYGKDNDGTHDVKITKTIAGNQAVKSQNFHFQVKVTAKDGAAEKYLVKYSKDGKTETTDMLQSGVQKEYEMTNEGYVLVYGLSEGDVVDVKEKEANSDGYTTTIQANTTQFGSNLIKNEATGTLQTSVKKDGAIIGYLNEKNGVIPTGVMTTAGPSLILVLAATGLGVAFFRKKAE